MFVAKAATGQLVTLRDHAQARQLTGAFTCPACGAPVGIRNGAVMPAHFYHRGPACAASEPESAEHLNGKLWLLNYGARRGFGGTLEQYYPAIQQRADVVWWPAGKPLVVEFQCSPISVTKLAARTAGYHRLGLPVVWVMGRRYFEALPHAKQAKFLHYTQARGWHLWFLDVAAGRLVLWQFAPTQLVIHWYWRSGERVWTRPLLRAPKREALAIQRGLIHRDPRIMVLQQACAAAGHNLAGAPWVVHAESTHLIGLTAPEWQLRTWWLLAFERQPAITAEAEAAFWPRFAGPLTPLADPAALLAAVRRQWLATLIERGLLVTTDAGWRWRQAPQWFATLDAKLQAGAEGVVRQV